MDFGIVAPALIGPGTNPPAYSPIGGGVVAGTITLQDLARGVVIYANRYEGGQEVARAAMDRHCSAADSGLQFLAFVEEEAYSYLQFDRSGNRIPGCIPVITLRKSEVLTDERIDILVKAFKAKEVSIEYVIGGKDNGIYSDEIDRLGRKIIDAEVGGYVLVFDQSDSVMMRRRHNTKEPHIKTIADILSRQSPMVGFIASGTGPGNGIIEGVRRAEIFVGKKLTTHDKIYGFSTITSKDVIDNWDKGFGYQNVRIEHAWKHDRSGRSNPELLDLPTVSAILDGNRKTLKTTEHPNVKALRLAMSKAKSKGKKVGKKRKSTGMGRIHLPEPHSTRRDSKQAPFAGRSLNDAATARGHRMASKGVAAALALLENGLVPGRSLDAMTFEEVVDFIMSDEVMENLRRAGNTCSRTKIYSVAGFSLAHMLLDRHGPATEDFFALMGAKGEGDPGSPAQRLVAKLRKMETRERTPARVADFVMQAWHAHGQQRPIRCFRDSAVPLTPSNDNGRANDRAA